EGAPAVAGQLPAVVGRRRDVLNRLAHERRGPTPHLQVAPRGDAVDVGRIETHRQRGLELRAERVAHLLEWRAADDVEPERRPDQPAHRAPGEAPRHAVERRGEPARAPGPGGNAPCLGPWIPGI